MHNLREFALIYVQSIVYQLKRSFSIIGTRSGRP